AAAKVRATISEAAQRRRHRVKTRKPIAAILATTMGRSASRLTEAACNDSRRTFAEARADESIIGLSEAETKNPKVAHNPAAITATSSIQAQMREPGARRIRRVRRVAGRLSSGRYAESGYIIEA